MSYNLAMRLMLVLLLAGCPSSGPKDPAFTKAGPKPCERMADHVVGLMQPTGADGKPLKKEPETADAITRVLIDRCTKDGWTQDAQKCFLEVASLEDASKCAPLLTVDQRNAMDQGIDQVFGPRKPPADAGSGSAAP